MSPALQEYARACDNVILPHLAFIGGMGSGKSTAADRMGVFRYDRLSFAEEVRNTVARLYGKDRREDRDLLQKIGHGMRQLDEDIWVRPFERAFRHSWGIRAGGNLPGLRAVVDDCRYNNEADTLHAVGFLFVRVEAERNVRLARLQANGKITDEAQLEHDSEHALDVVPDFTITNNPGDDMDAQLITLVNKLAR